MKIAKNILTILGCVVANFAFAQNYIPYYPADWEFKNNADLVDFSQVKSVTTKYLTIDENEEYPVYETYLSWNNTYQLTDYQFVNYNNSYADFDVQINYANPNGNALKSVKIVNPNTLKPIEEWQYTNGSFNVEKISVKRYLLNVTEPDVFEVKYEGNDDDFVQETVYTPQNKINSQTKYWEYRKDDGSYQLVKKLYLDNFLDQTDSLIFNSDRKKIAHYIINLSIATKTDYTYKHRKVEIAGDEHDYQQLERIIKDGKDTERYEYEYDAKGNWIVRKTYKMKNGKWEYTDITRREIEYKN
ncbi:hypothetical protein BCY91_15005 [Pelobium manganitolerans]|uniref:DUF4595 domain-containing protein n=1 Tax=Pelobium manganitolerans TaxID=1842495 RepID=A0A419S9V5_9SPHI|nr:hypothetical protein [Pelobium manganitolerans]RKD18642.1 hypothetical protein BCY91_15005 [Pelobium manganitolerans]